MQFSSINKDFKLSIKERMLSVYLKSNGWKEVIDDDFTRWYFDNNFEIALSNNKDIKDYNYVIFSALKTISYVEKRPIENIIYDLENYVYDILRIRLDTQPEIYFYDNIINSIKGIFKSVALSIDSPKNVYYKTTKKCDELLQNTLIGHTEVGSYVMTLLTRVEGALDTSVEIPKGRIFSSRLLHSLKTSHDVLNLVLSKGDFNIVNDHILDGISANLFESLADLCEFGCKNSISFDMKWSGLYSYNVDKEVIIINKTYYPLMKECANYLKESITQDIDTKGYVIGLKSTDINYGGEVIVNFETMDGKNKQIKLSLNKEQYEIAIKAHEEARMVLIAGETKSINKRLEMIRLSEFSKSAD